MYSSPLTPADLQLREQFEARTLANGAFRHREHVRLTWIYLTSQPPEVGAASLGHSLLALATSHGRPDPIHYTLTVAWIRIIEGARRAHPDLPFDALVDAVPSLLDKDAPLAYYTRDCLYSDTAKQSWIEPDVQPLPQ